MRVVLAKLALSLFVCVSIEKAAAENLLALKGMVYKHVEDLGLNIGYNEKQDLYVEIGIASQEIGSETLSKLCRVRNDAFKIAVINAKKALLNDIAASTAEKVELNTQTEANLNERSLHYTLQRFAKGRILGCMVLMTAEELDESLNRLHVAAVVYWSSKFHSRLKKSKLKSEEFELSAPDEEWDAWCKKHDLSRIMGSRQFTDKDGNERILGVGAVEIEGLKGTDYKLAKMQAREDAQEQLEFTLLSDNVARTIAKSYSKEVQNKTGKKNITWNRFTSEVISQCKMRALPSGGTEVYSIETIDPITGKEIYISVCGTIIK